MADTERIISKELYNEPDYIPLTNDLLFHMVFTKNQKALRSLLSSLLNMKEEEIIDIEILNPVQYTDAFDTKMTILDLKLHLNDLSYVLVEMQVRKFLSWTNRTLAYACRQITDQTKGNEFQYSGIQPVIQIAIMDYTLFPEHKRFLAKYLLRDEEGYQYSDKLQFYVLDLTAVAEANEQEKAQGLVEWANAFRAKDWTDADQIENNGVKEAMKTMRVIMGTPTERQLLWDRKMAIWDYNDSIAGAKAYGMEEGRKIGIEEGRLEGRKIGIEEGRQEGRQEGRKIGIEEGRQEGEGLVIKLMSSLMQLGRTDDIEKALADPVYRQQLYQELKIS